LRVGGDDGELRPWHYIYVYSIESGLITRVRYDSHLMGGTWQVPLYSQLLQERFERCLDLYLCPRTVKKRQPYTLNPEP